MTARKSTSIRLTESEHRALNLVAKARGTTKTALIRDGIAYMVSGAPVTGHTNASDGPQRVIYALPEIPDTASSSEKERLSLLGQAAMAGYCPKCNALGHLAPEPADGPPVVSVRPVDGPRAVTSVSLKKRPTASKTARRVSHFAPTGMLAVEVVIAHEQTCPAAHSVTSEER